MKSKPGNSEIKFSVNFPKDSNEMTPLHFAAKEGHIIICEIIIDAIEEKNPKNNHKCPLNDL